MIVNHLNEDTDSKRIIQLDGGRSISVETWGKDSRSWGWSMKAEVYTDDSVSDNEVKEAIINKFDRDDGFIFVSKDNVNTTSEYSVWNISFEYAD